LRKDGGKSIIAHLFAGEFIQRTVCVAGHASDVATPFVTMSLPCPQQTLAVELMDLLREFFRPPELDDSNRYFCPTCGYVRARSSSRISVAPPVLILHIRRMGYQGGGERTSTLVRVPEVLTMDSDSLENSISGTVTYRLLFCVDHHGTMERGHFVAHVRSGSTRHTCSDGQVLSDTGLPYGGFPTSTVYLVGYERANKD
jgi:ubiquitin C-terminal hydrolase